MLTTCGIYLYSTRKRKFLVCHPTRGAWHQWSIPKGLRDGQELLLDVAKREMLEETGIDLSKLNVKGIFALAPVKYVRQNKILESFLVITDSDLGDHEFASTSMTKLDYPEIDSWKWIRMIQMENWLHESQKQNLPQIKNLLKSSGAIKTGSFISQST